MAGVTLNDVQLQTSDYIRNYTTGNIDNNARNRAINRSVEYFQRRLGLPSDKRIFTFAFVSTTPAIYTDLPAGFNEPIRLFYSYQNNNVPSHAWTYRPDVELLPYSGLQFLASNNYGFTTINQKLQLLLMGSNMSSGISDTMNCIYYSSYKGYVTGSSPKTDILNFDQTNLNDFFYFGNFAPDLIGPISKMAAVELMPALRQDKEWYGQYKQDVAENIKAYGRIYPRRREIQFGKTTIERSSFN